MERNISYVCLHFELNGKRYEDDFGESISFDELYSAMRAGADTKTTQLNAAEFEDYFDSLLSQGKDVLHVCVSSGVSGTYNSACIAKESVQAKYPERKIYVLDSLGGSSGLGLLMDKLADLRDEGKTIDELCDWVLKNRLKIQYWLFSTDLTFFIRGGRISKAAGIAGMVLNICPLITIGKEGSFVPYRKVRTKRKVMRALIEKMEELAQNGLDYSDKCYMCHSGCFEDARTVADMIEEKFKKLKGRVVINNIGTSIGCHAGPGTVGLFFWGKERTL